MNALILTLFVSAGLTVIAVILYMATIKNKTHDHVDRLSLLPLLEDDGAVVVRTKRKTLTITPRSDLK